AVIERIDLHRDVRAGERRLGEELIHRLAQDLPVARRGARSQGNGGQDQEERRTSVHFYLEGCARWHFTKRPLARQPKPSGNQTFAYPQTLVRKAATSGLSRCIPPCDSPPRSAQEQR